MFWTKSRTKLIGDLVTYFLVITFSIVILIPVLWMLSTALKELSEVFLFPPRWVPAKLNWDNFPKALTFLPFAQYFANTSLITFGAVIGQLLSSPMVAYAFARLRARNKEMIFILILATMMLPWQVTMIPLFLGYKTVGLIDTFVPLILPNFFGGAFYIFLLRQFFLTISPELADAAKIDGCGYFQTFTRIYLPLSKPALATVAIFEFIARWRDYLGPLIYLSNQKLYTLSLGIYEYRSQYGAEWGLLMAASVLITLPIILLFFFLQKTFVQGIALTGIKG
ncbi:MAG: carbohydrate ABC transporter permease [Anaerolineaceae bacterium]|nr:carbohydrate ABC transporter permease [Anaerolineaceae bacterium]